MPLLLEYRRELAKKLGGYIEGTVTVDPDLTDPLAARQVLSDKLYDSDKNAKGMSNDFMWVGKYKDQRRCRDSGYRSLFYAVFIPPTLVESPTYKLTFYGYGTTADIAYNADATTVQNAIIATNISLASVTISGSGNPYIVNLPDNIDMEVSHGTMVSQGGIGAIEVNRSFSKALRRGDVFEKHVKLPVDDADDFQGLNTVINMALARMWFIKKFPITPVKNSRGIPSFFELNTVPWLTDQRQIIALYNSAQWEMVSIFTAPGSSTYTLTINMATGTYTTTSLAFNATASQIQTALAATGINIPIIVSGIGPFTITMGPTYYATPTITASSGTVVNSINMLTSPARANTNWKFQPDAENTYLDNYFTQDGWSFFVEAYRPANTWYCPQISYGTPGTIWTDTKTGLLDDYDQAWPPVQDVSTMAYYLACKQLSAVGPSTETQYWKNESLSAARAAAGMKMWDLPFENKPRGGAYNYNGAGFGSKGFWT